MSRRGENIYKRKDGRYEGRYIRERNMNGKIRFGYVYGYAYSEVKLKLVKLKNTRIKNNHRGNESQLYNTISDYMSYWLEEVANDNIKESTYTRYHERIYGYIVPAIGDIKLSKLSENNIQYFIDDLKKKQLSASTIKGIFILLKSAMKHAFELNLIDQNPCTNIKLPAIDTKEINVLNRPEQIKIENAATQHSDMAEIYTFLSLYVGLRIGEICALRWRDIDLDSGTLFVRNTLQRIKNMNDSITSKTIIVEGKPKSKHSYRQVPISSEIVCKLKNYKSITNNPDDDCYVLSGSNKVIEPRHLRYDFDKLLKINNISKISFHILRHTYATRCIEHNFDIKSLSELMGHSNAATTLNIYTHSVTEHKKSLSERIHILSQYNEPSNTPSTNKNLL